MPENERIEEDFENKQNLPLVSVLIPVTGNPTFIDSALRSVLKQTYKNIEILLLLNQADLWVSQYLGKIKEEDQRLQIHILKEIGISNALNFGLGIAKGELICRIDADDTMEEERLERQIEYMIENKETEVLGTQIWKINEHDSITGYSSFPLGPAEVREILPIRNVIAHPSVIFRKERILSIGGYNSQFDGMEDYELWLRALKIANISNLGLKLTNYRSWNGQVTKLKSPSKVAKYRFIRARYFRLENSEIPEFEMGNLVHNSVVNRYFRNVLFELLKRRRFQNAFELLSAEAIGSSIEKARTESESPFVKVIAIFGVFVGCLLRPKNLKSYVYPNFKHYFYSRLRKFKKVEIEIQGGIGNQLFQFFAALQTKSNSEFDFLMTESNKEQIMNGLMKFDLVTNNKKINFVIDERDELCRKMDRFALRKSQTFRSLIYIFGRKYYSSPVGYDKGKENLGSFRRISGYFQSYLYIPNEIFRNGIKLKTTTTQLSLMISQLRNEDPIVIHFRGGDYFELRESFGILSNRYYERALELLSEQSNKNKIWLFTNDLDLSTEIFSKSSFPIARVISPKDFTAPETLILMSCARRIVISNSTFAWWGAYVSGEDKKVIAPQKWFKNMEDPLNLIPRHWRQIESSWW